MINLICAIDENFAIGYNNKLLYHLKKDMKFFREKTLGSFCIMGKNTFLSLPKPLEKRTNVVLTRGEFKTNYHNVVVEHDLDKALQLYKTTGSQDKNIFLIGGSEIYKQALPYVDVAYITFIASKAKQYDSIFPFLDLLKDFKIVETTYDCEDNIHFNILKFERKN